MNAEHWEGAVTMSSDHEAGSEELSLLQRERRAFMERAGKLAAFTPPVMLGLMLPGQHAIASGVYGADGKLKKLKKPKKRK
jgi:hypothetical protein